MWLRSACGSALQDGGADDRAGQRAHPAEDHEDQDQHRLLER